MTLLEQIGQIQKRINVSMIGQERVRALAEALEEALLTPPHAQALLRNVAAFDVLRTVH